MLEPPPPAAPPPPPPAAPLPPSPAAPLPPSSPLPRVAARPAPPAYSARVREILAAGRALLAAEGPEALTMRRVGGEVGIRAASLYKHLPGKAALEAALVEAALFEIGDALHAVVDAAAASDGVGALLAEYRRVALGEANLYRLATSGRIDRGRLTAGLDAWSGEPFYRATGEPYVAQALFAAAHGAVILEMDRAYSDTSDLDATWRALAAAFAR
ncbi:TetR family transcriptional regulator [Pseudofrankia sp. DC12]|uniref:TetR family transcriptional regulator n=1 Tax=Pseudofrankia sp. DC12 TaxID=683315 RepID=UPI0009FD6290|nr:TetR family transcriptional regulator [Pseudofrankia sp. DC12]